MHPDDSVIVSGCLAGQRAAWERLVREHAPAMLRAAAAVVPGDAEDIVQRALMRLLEDGARRLAGFAGSSRLGTWLVVIARREALARRPKPPPEPIAVDGPPDPHRLAELGEDRERLLMALAGLPARDQLLIQVVWLDGGSYAQAALLLGAPESSISPWLGRARARLRAAYEANAGRCTDPPARSVEGVRTR